MPVLRRPWARLLALSYPVLTLFGTVATGNHYVLDGIAGVALTTSGYVIACTWRRPGPAVGRQRSSSGRHPERDRRRGRSTPL